MAKHNTFPDEKSEIPVTGKKPEIRQPHDPKEPGIPEEGPQREPEELPPGTSPQEHPTINPGNIN